MPHDGWHPDDHDHHHGHRHGHHHGHHHGPPRRRLILAAATFPPFGGASAQTVDAAQRITDAANRFLGLLDDGQRRKALIAFESDNRLDWHYIPRSRSGLTLGEMTVAQAEAARALFATVLNDQGLKLLDGVRLVEGVLREQQGSFRDPGRYYVSVFGTPGRFPWGWRFEGHHLSLNFTLVGDRLVVDTPSFFGANPATVPSGAKKGLRVLGDEHDAGWAMLDSLSESQRREAVLSTRTYGDIVTSNREKVAPLDAAGIAASKLDERQRALLWKLVELYAASFEPGLAEARLARARQGGIESLIFGWAGSITRGSPHYYRVQGARFLIEYDASQDGGNHIHTVWRDFTGDFGEELPLKGAFGRDLLRDHYASSRGTTHRH